MNLSNSIYFFLFILLFAACEEPIELEIPEESRQLSVVGVFSTFSPFLEESPFEVALQKSRAVTSDDPFEYVKDAHVQLFKENQLLEILTYNEDHSKYFSTLSMPESGSEYTLLIEHPDHETITAHTKIPSKATILSTTPRNLTGSPNPIYKDLEDYRFTIDIELKDLEEEENYYQFLFYNREINFRIESNLDTTFEQTNTFSLAQFDVEQVNEKEAIIVNNNSFYGSYLKDESFNGQNKIVQFSFVVPIRSNQIARQLLMEVRTIPKEYYDFYITAYQSSETGFNPYASSPVAVKSNVENATGIFAGYSSEFKLIRLQ